MRENTKPSAADSDRDFEFTDKDFAFIKKLVRESTGIVLSDIKKDMVYGRLSRRLRQLNMTRFNEYCSLLKSGHSQEMHHFTNAITTNLTSFFRENHHFDYLRDTVIPQLLKNGKSTIKIWSAGCSSGEEPYSIAIAVKEALGARAESMVKILATDLDTNVLDRAASGVYDIERVSGLPEMRIKKWFKKGSGQNEGYVKVHPELQSMITFKQLNLMKDWPMKGPFDIIFCRNVVIYFDKPTQKQLFDRYANILDGDGHLFLGHSESMFKVSTRFHLIGKTVYSKLHETSGSNVA